MKVLTFILAFISLSYFSACSQGKKPKPMSNASKDAGYNKLTPAEERVIVEKGTDAPFVGKYTYTKDAGTYVCRRCNAPLYNSGDKFDSHCGWPSFDDEIPGAVERVADADGERTEIVCKNCNAHLGHVFLNEGLTDKNTRHCVNSTSLLFVPAGKKTAALTQKAYFAGGCFWGMEYHFHKVKGVVATKVGFMGGSIKNPSYEQVSTGKTGHAETLEVTFDPSQTNFENLAKLFFEIHDQAQVDRQGPDIGTQYRSAIFYTSAEQKNQSEALIQILKNKGFSVATELKPAGAFYTADEHHQEYYEKTGGSPYCHRYTKKF